MSVRIRDFALLIGHVWRCPNCRQALFERPGNRLSRLQIKW